ncbi:MAG: hypothetical protein ACTS3F_01225 [Phycisphaerales bacterium]
MNGDGERERSDGGAGAGGAGGSSGGVGAGRERGGLLGRCARMIRYTLLGLGISSPDERRENFRKWERYRSLREAERRRYGSTLDDAVRSEHEWLEERARERRGGDGDGAGGGDRA